MKNILFVLLIFPTLFFSQTEKSQTEKKVEYFIDSVKVDYSKVYLNGKNIKNINVVKVGNIGDGKLFINLVNNKVLCKLSDLKHSNFKKLKNPIFIINNKIITIPSEILFDKSEIGNLEIISNRDFENNNGKFTIVKITTKSEQLLLEEKKKGIIRIKGKELTQNE